MSRTVDKAAHESKREAILDQAALLVATVGYEQMSIEHLIGKLGISRGALYHYFDSKQAILGALVDRMANDAVEALVPIIENPSLTAVEKFQRYVEASMAFKSDRRELISDLSRIWYSEENLRVRHKLVAATLDHTAGRILEPIIRQGIAEKVFDIRFPAETARIIAGIWLGLADGLIMLGTSGDQHSTIIERATGLIEATTDSVERILNAPRGSLNLGTVEELLQLSRPDDPPRHSGRKDN